MGTLQREGANTMRAPCAATGKTLAPPTTNTIAMDATNIRHTTEKTEITEPTTATGTTPTSNLKATSTAAADATSMKQTMDTIFTITAKMVTDTTMITSERRPADMKRSAPPQMMTPVLPPVKVAGDIEKTMECVA